MRSARQDWSLAFLKIWYSVQPFPGPGLGVRIIGEVTADKVRIVQDADAIYREEIAKAGADKNLGQYFAALTNMRSVAAWEMKEPMTTPSPSVPCSQAIS